MKILLKEHSWLEIAACAVEDPTQPLQINEASFAKIREDNVRLFKRERRGTAVYPFLLQRKNEQVFRLQADYYIGIDWLIPGERCVQVEPKINKKLALAFNKATDVIDFEESETVPEAQEVTLSSDEEYVEVDYLRMLLGILSTGLPEQHINKLILIDWQAPRIPITQKEDRLTPFLVVQFLQLLKTIVRKGLKKSYYKVWENLRNRVKGKILVGSHIRQNVLKNRLTQTHCEYHVFGEDNIENRFLKKVFHFATSYVANNKTCLGRDNIGLIEQLINYSRPALEHIGNELNEEQLKQVRHNPFFREYKEAIAIGRHILKKFAYNISETSTQKQTTPPFWIDMPKLFELYCYVQLLKANPKDKKHIHYQFSTYGNALDILITKPSCELVIDAKYKLQYQTSKVHQDIRQVAGYARLKKVRNELNITDDRNIDCLIIYPDVNANVFDYTLDGLLKAAVEIDTYHKVYKLGVSVPLIENGTPL